MHGMPAAELCIVNVAADKWYPLGQQRLAASVRTRLPGAAHLLWTNQLPPSSPTHAQRPYAFKYHALSEARRRGYRTAWWLDASMVMVHSPRQILALAGRHGVFLAAFHCYRLGEWISDAALRAFGLTRDQAMDMEKINAANIVLDFASPRAHALLDQMLEWSEHPDVFPGDRANHAGRVSADPRVQGHRHDQAALSIVAPRLGINVCRPSSAFARDDDRYRLLERTCLVCRRGCRPRELRGKVGSLRWRVWQACRDLL